MVSWDLNPGSLLCGLSTSRSCSAAPGPAFTWLGPFILMKPAASPPRPWRGHCPR